MKKKPSASNKKRELRKVCIYKSSCSADANKVRKLLEDVGVPVLIHDCGNTVPLPLGADTVSRNLEILVDEGDVPVARKVFRNNKIVNTGWEAIGLQHFVKPLFLLMSLLAFIVFFPPFPIPTLVAALLLAIVVVRSLGPTSVTNDLRND